MRSPLTVETRRRAYEEDPKWPAKAVLRILATVFALIAMPLFAAAISYTDGSYINTTGPGDWTDGLALAPVRLPFHSNRIDLAHTKTGCHLFAIQPYRAALAFLHQAWTARAPVHPRRPRPLGLGPFGPLHNLWRCRRHVLVLDTCGPES